MISTWEARGGKDSLRRWLDDRRGSKRSEGYGSIREIGHMKDAYGHLLHQKVV